MSKKVSFKNLAEELESLSDEELEKSNEKAEEVATQSEDKEPKAEEPKAEEPKAEEPKAEEPKAEEPKAEEPKAINEEELKAAAKDLPEGVKPGENKAPAPVKEEPKAEEPKPTKEEPKAEDKPVKGEEKLEKSKPSENSISETDIVGVLETIVKSYTAVKGEQASVGSRLAKIEKSLGEVVELLSKSDAGKEGKAEEPVKAEEPNKEESKPEEPIHAEEIQKSATPAEEPEGKAVEYISKSTESGVGVPEAPEGAAQGNEEPAGEETKEFVAADHVKEVTAFYMDNAPRMSPGDREAFRAAVQRVKRNDATESDIELFKQTVGFVE